jgi:hypothetical protein
MTLKSAANSKFSPQPMLFYGERLFALEGSSHFAAAIHRWGVGN